MRVYANIDLVINRFKAELKAHREREKILLGISTFEKIRNFQTHRKALHHTRDVIAQFERLIARTETIKKLQQETLILLKAAKKPQGKYTYSDN